MLLEAPGGGLDDGESLREDPVEGLLDGLVLVLDQLVGLAGELLFLCDGDIFVELELDLGDAVLERFFDLLQVRPERRGALAERIVRQGVDFRIDGKDLVERGLHSLVVAVGLGAKDLADNGCK